MRAELQETRYQMDAVSWKVCRMGWGLICFMTFSQASSINAVSDIEKREKKGVMKKLTEMEKELKVSPHKSETNI